MWACTQVVYQLWYQTLHKCHNLHKFSFSNWLWSWEIFRKPLNHYFLTVCCLLKQELWNNSREAGRHLHPLYSMACLPITYGRKWCGQREIKIEFRRTSWRTSWDIVGVQAENWYRSLFYGDERIVAVLRLLIISSLPPSHDFCRDNKKIDAW